jgi:hypothetical protein
MLRGSGWRSRQIRRPANRESFRMQSCSESLVVAREKGGAKPDEDGTLPLTYEWDMISDKGELAKGGWAGQLLYINREKDVVIAYFGTNQIPDPKIEPLPCRIIARTFF